eukprot:2122020-Amphidinium_carterae.1
MQSQGEVSQPAGSECYAGSRGEKHFSQQSASLVGRPLSKVWPARANFHPQWVRHKVGVSEMEHEDAL